MADDGFIKKILDYINGKKKDDSANDNRYGNMGKGSQAYKDARDALDEANGISKKTKPNTTVADGGDYTEN